MKKIYIVSILFYTIALVSNLCEAQAGQWTWIGGPASPYGNGTHGTKGVPAPNTLPASLYGPGGWKDTNGNFWLFGGASYNNTSVNLRGDLWKYDLISNQWTWMTGRFLLNDTGNYGAMGVPSVANNPPSRGYGFASWTDLDGNFWLFGGFKPNGIGNDLWKYDVAANEWTWMKGDSAANQPGVFGNMGVPDSANTPSAREECIAAWTDISTGDLWLFGGLGTASYNDLWKYNIATNEWTWMKGSQIAGQPGVYGIKGTEDSLNIPGAREVHCRWTDDSGNFWLYGGQDYPANENYGDMWRFNPATNNWTWMNGDSITNAPGIYGTKCTTSPLNKPPALMENRGAWKDGNGNFWMFGGAIDPSETQVMNHLWMYCVASNQWTWMSGDTTANTVGNWGTKGVASPTNKPNGRGGTITWSDNNGHLYFFGGTSGLTTHINPYNDLWQYTIDPCCSNCNIASSVASFTSDDSTLCVGDCSNFTDQSANTTSWQWIFEGGTPSSATGQSPPSVCYYAGGIYDVTLIASNCSTSDTIVKSKYVTVHPSPPTPNIVHKGDSLICSTDPSYVSYQWFFNSTPVPGATDTVFANAQTGNYNVKVVDTNGCSIAVGINIVGLLELYNNSSVSLFPNPVLNELNIKNEKLAIEKIGIYNVIGEQIYNQQQSANIRKQEINIDVSALAAGVYFVKLTGEKDSWVSRFVKQ